MTQLTTSITGGATGTASTALDVASWVGDWTARVLVTSLVAGKKASITLCDSADDFSADSRTLFTVDVTGPVNADAAIEKSIRAYQAASARVGLTGGKIRLLVQSADSGANVNAKLILEG
jgi:hypothetical protein